MKRLALLSVYNKTGIVELAKRLVSLDYNIISSGGTARSLIDNGVSVQTVTDFTGSPEVLGGRVKTLHPKVHAGILSTDSPDHITDLMTLGTQAINIVVVNLYPFQEVIAKGAGTTPEEEAIENIDIGGHTLIRSAAKNYKFTWVITDPDDYQKLTDLLSCKFLTSETLLQERKMLAVKGFQHATEYDMAISHYFQPDVLYRRYTPVHKLKYGCNPSQAHASVYSIDGQDLPFEVLNGAPGYINVLDAVGSWGLVSEMSRVLPDCICATSFKHTSPAGSAIYLDPLSDQDTQVFMVSGTKEYTPVATAVIRAINADPMSSFGDFVAVNKTVDKSAAEYLKTRVSDGIIAPDYTDEAYSLLSSKKGGKYIILRARQESSTSSPAGNVMIREMGQSLALAQNSDPTLITKDLLKNQVTEEKIDLESDRLVSTILLGMVTCKYTQSNSVVYAVDGQCIGIGAGQQSRRKCVELAGEKAKVWFLRKHPSCIGLPTTAGAKKQQKVNEILDFITGQGGTTAFSNSFSDTYNVDDELDWMVVDKKICLISDAFYPNRDNIDLAAKYRTTVTIQPGGSIVDESVISACNEHGIAMCFTNLRLFLH